MPAFCHEPCYCRHTAAADTRKEYSGHMNFYFKTNEKQRAKTLFYKSSASFDTNGYLASNL
jgi:hypothetical protein